MALTLTLPAVTIGSLRIPERTFTEGIDFEIGSILQEGETTYREEMVAIIPTGNNSQVFRDYAQHIGSQRAILEIDQEKIEPGVPPAQRPPQVPADFITTGATHNTTSYSWTAASGATGYDLFFTLSTTRPTEATRPSVTVGAVEEYTRLGQSPNTTYYAYIRSRGPGGLSAWTSAVVVTTPNVPLAAPPSPTGFGSTASTSDSITYGWTASARATGYDLYITTSATDPTRGTTPTASVGNVSTYTATGLSASTEYRAYIRAKNSAGFSNWSAVVTVTTPAVTVVAPPTPTAFVRTATTSDSITYGWDASARATGYDLYVTTSATPPTAQTSPTVSVGAVTTYTRTGLSGGTTYYAYLRAKNSAGASAWSGAVTVLTPIALPGIPQNFMLASGSGTHQEFIWNLVPSATSYELYITTGITAPTASTTPIDTVAGGSTLRYSFTGAGFQNSTTYRAYIRARNSAGAGDWSAGLVFTTPAIAVPDIPQNFTSSAITFNSIAYTWNATPRATGYDLYVTDSAVPPVDSTAPTASVGAVTEYTRTGLSETTTYYAYIRAKNSSGAGTWSEAQTAITLAAPLRIPLFRPICLWRRGRTTA